MFKRYITIALVALLFCTIFISCGKDDSTIKIGDYEVPKGVYTYFYDESKDEEDPENSAIKKCKEYIAVDILMDKAGTYLSTTRKGEAAEKTENLWGMFSSYYNSIGVTKQDINLIATNEMNKIQLLHYYYGKGGKNEISTADIKKEFDKTYVGFKAIEAELTKTDDLGDTLPLSTKEKSTLKKELNAIANRINSGSDPDEENVIYNEKRGLIVTQELSLNIIKSDDPLYSEDFFNAVSRLSYGKAGVIECGNKIYMLQRQRIDSNDEVFSLYADKVLEEMKMEKIEGLIEKTAKSIGD